MANGRKPRHTFPQPQPSQFAPADLFSRKPLPGGGQRCQNVGMSELEISVGELQGKKKAGESFLLIDVREPWEYDLCRIAGAKLIPMGTIPANLQQLDGDEQVICYCHHGQRSLEVWPHGCARKVSSKRNRWPEASSAGLWRLIRASLVTSCEPKQIAETAARSGRSDGPELCLGNRQWKKSPQRPAANFSRIADLRRRKRGRGRWK